MYCNVWGIWSSLYGSWLSLRREEILQWSHTSHMHDLDTLDKQSTTRKFFQRAIVQYNYFNSLTICGRVTHMCVGKLTIIVSDNDLSPGRRQAIIWTNAGILLIGPLGTNFSEISIGIHTFSLQKCLWKCRLRNGVHFVSSVNVLTHRGRMTHICENNSSPPSATYMRQWTRSALVQDMACHLFGAKPSPKPMLTYGLLDSREQTSVKFESKYKKFHSWKYIWKYHLRNGSHFVQGKWDKSSLFGTKSLSEPLLAYS